MQARAAPGLTDCHQDVIKLLLCTSPEPWAEAEGWGSATTCEAQQGGCTYGDGRQVDGGSAGVVLCQSGETFGL